MRKKYLLLSLVFFLLISGQCKKSTSSNSELKNILKFDKNRKSTNNVSSTKNQNLINKYPIIKEVEVIPDNLKPDDTVRINVTYDSGGIKDIKKYYVFYKNGKKVGSGDSNTFKLEKFKKNDFFSCEIYFYKEDSELGKAKTPYIKVLGSPPEIKEVIFPKKIDKPGKYEIKIIASDPDENDKLTFEISNENSLKIPAKIKKVSPNEAILNLSLSPEDFGKINIVKIKIKDEDGLYIMKELKLDLKKKVVGSKNKKQKESKESKGAVKRGEGIPIRKIGFKGGVLSAQSFNFRRRPDRPY